MNDFFKKGFTLVEVLIALAILTMISLAAINSFSGSRSRIALDEGKATLIFALEQARNKSASGVGTGTEEHGIIIQENKIIPFKKNQEGEIVEGSQIEFPSAIFANQTSTIIFGRLSGLTGSNTEIIIKHAITNATTAITVTEQGRIIID